jgi:hypothetical protein
MQKPKLFVIGVYLLEQKNRVSHLITEFSRSQKWTVEQAWVALGASSVPVELWIVTSTIERTKVPKFTLLNRLLAQRELNNYEYVILCDDDISVPSGFLDNYLDFVVRYDFALAQPARTIDSFIDHIFVRQLGGIDARQTRFVEIGPLFSVRRDAFRLLFPFDEKSPMGWGYDFFWPCLLSANGLRLGVVDAIPVAHNLRKPVSNYSHSEADKQMKDFLRTKKHLSKAEAFSIVESYTLPK